MPGCAKCQKGNITWHECVVLFLTGYTARAESHVDEVQRTKLPTKMDLAELLRDF